MELWRQILIDRDACYIKAEHNALLFKDMHLLYDVEFKVSEPPKCSLCNEPLNGIAIYGAGKLGMALASFIHRRGCTVDYFIDKKGSAIQCDWGISCYLPKQPLPDSQLLVVTPEYDYDDIALEMRPFLKCPIIAMSDFLQEQLT